MTNEEINRLQLGDIVKWYSKEDDGDIHTYMQVCSISPMRFKTLLDISTGRFGVEENRFDIGFIFTLKRSRLYVECALLKDLPSD